MIDYEQGFWKPGCAVETRHVLSAATFKIVCGWMCAGRRVNISCGSSMPCGQTYSIRCRKWRGQSTISVALRAIAAF